MKKKSFPVKLSTRLQNVFGSRDWHILWQTYKLVEHWQEVAGEAVAAKSTPAYVRKNILWIYVNDSIWMQHLQAQKTGLLAKVRNFNDELVIHDIRWLMQPHEEKENYRNVIQPPVKINPEEQKKFAEIAATVKDEQCYNALCRLWQAYHRNPH
ncbi:MAG: DUF721 domain-containing protein [Desulfobulbaceae bacterium]|nr:DUF721 domain-containing protein [Desulfobulbaceae bacterium]